MSTYTEKERVTIVIDMMKNLKKFKLNNGEILDLYNNNNSFITELKVIGNNYIKEGKTQKGYLFFKEINKKIEYHFPEKSYKKPLLVIRM
jgi:hypothetical protein